MLATLIDIPEETVLHILQLLDLDSLVSISSCSRKLRRLCLEHIFPKHAAEAAGVDGLTINDDASRPASVREWVKLIRNLSQHLSSRTLHVAVQVKTGDSVSSLALEYAVSPHEICRTNALFSENHLATRDFLYIPLATESAVHSITGASRASQRPALVRACTLAGRAFLVVCFKRKTGSTIRGTTVGGRESYVRELIVRLVAKGFSVDEAEVRFYLEENNYDMSKACKAMLRDREWDVSSS